MYEKTARKDGFRFFGGVARRRGRHPRRAARALPRGALRDRHVVGQPPRHPRRGPARLLRRHALRGLVQRPSRRLRRASSTSAPRAPSSSATATSRSTSRACSSSTPTSWRRPTPPTTRSQALAASQVEEVVLLGRRGPAQAAFTNPELRELGELSRAAPVVDPGELELDEASRDLAGDGGRRRPTAATSSCSRSTPARPLGDASHRITLRFLRSPLELLGEGEDGP